MMQRRCRTGKPAGHSFVSVQPVAAGVSSRFPDMQGNMQRLPKPPNYSMKSMVNGGGDVPDIQPSLVDAALICKEFLNIRHVIECGLLSGLLVRPDRCRWPGW
ncbi:MAG: hypothetical protein KBG46_12260, partial [Paracoccus sp.]|nr:hypothetical protein [Paracoccus sp. (in: a-proteobacteria)]